MDYKDIIYEKKPPVAYITLNRPEKMNALSSRPNGGLLLQWEDATNDVRNDPAIRICVIKGAGRCFSAGYDIGGPPAPKVSDEERYDNFITQHVLRYVRCLWDNPKVFIAQVHGFCLAGGGDMAAFCDITYAADDAVFGYPAVRYGVMPTTFIWPFLIGMKKSRELAYTGNMMSAQEAYNFRLVNKVVPRAQLEEEVEKLVDAIIKVPAMSVKLSKVSVNNMIEMMGFRQSMRLNGELDLHVGIAPPPELVEFRQIVQEKGLKAALEWRDAKFAASSDVGKDLRARKYS